MNKKSVITCPYCGSELETAERDYYCEFCVMKVPASLAQRDHNRIMVRTKDIAFESYLEKTTPELMTLSTYELLELLQIARKERSAYYGYLNTFRKAAEQSSVKEFEESSKYTGEQYEQKTRKMFVIENIIRQRLGYVPHRITSAFLANYLDQMKKDKTAPMVIRQQRSDQIRA